MLKDVIAKNVHRDILVYKKKILKVVSNAIAQV